MRIIGCWGLFGFQPTAAKPKYWTLTKGWALVWMVAKYLAHPGCPGFSSSI